MNLLLFSLLIFINILYYPVFEDILFVYRACTFKFVCTVLLFSFALCVLSCNFCTECMFVCAQQTRCCMQYYFPLGSMKFILILIPYSEKEKLTMSWTYSGMGHHVKYINNVIIMKYCIKMYRSREKPYLCFTTEEEYFVSFSKSQSTGWNLR